MGLFLLSAFIAFIGGGGLAAGVDERSIGLLGIGVVALVAGTVGFDLALRMIRGRPRGGGNVLGRSARRLVAANVAVIPASWLLAFPVNWLFGVGVPVTVLFAAPAAGLVLVIGREWLRARRRRRLLQRLPFPPPPAPRVAVSEGAGADEPADPATQRIRELAKELTTLIPPSGGGVRVSDGPDELVIEGDRQGYLRFGLGLIHGAVEPTVSRYGHDDALDFEPEDLFPDSAGTPVILRRVAELPRAEPTTPRNKLLDAGCLVGCAILVFAIAFLAVVGLNALRRGL
ncbi:MAG TPA: hypothetical protein VF139_12815 [Candidatus Polarisedimenticolaceae bacterium]